MRPITVEVLEAIADMAWATSSVRIPVSTTDALTDVITAKYCSIGR
ncbi:MAG: hypothetical protein ACO3O3_04645 [Ilumatobacteraceae bacterium]